MKLWIDAQLSPALAAWITENFADIEAIAVRELGLREAINLLESGEILVEITG